MNSLLDFALNLHTNFPTIQKILKGNLEEFAEYYKRYFVERQIRDMKKIGAGWMEFSTDWEFGMRNNINWNDRFIRRLIDLRDDMGSLKETVGDVKEDAMNFLRGSALALGVGYVADKISDIAGYEKLFVDNVRLANRETGDLEKKWAEFEGVIRDGVQEIGRSPEEIGKLAAVFLNAKRDVGDFHDAIITIGRYARLSGKDISEMGETMVRIFQAIDPEMQMSGKEANRLSKQIFNVTESLDDVARNVQSEDLIGMLPEMEKEIVRIDKALGGLASSTKQNLITGMLAVRAMGEDVGTDTANMMNTIMKGMTDRASEEFQNISGIFKMAGIEFTEQDKLDYEAGKIEVVFSKLIQSFRILNQRAGGDLTAFNAILGQLGFSLDDVGNLLQLDEARINGFNDAMRRGRSGTESFDAVMKALDDTNAESLERIKAMVQWIGTRLFYVVGKKLAPEITKLVKWMGDLIDKHENLIAVVGSVVAGVIAVALAFAAIKTVGGLVIGVITSLWKAFFLLSKVTVFTATGLGKLILMIPGMNALWLSFTSGTITLGAFTKAAFLAMLPLIKIIAILALVAAAIYGVYWVWKNWDKVKVWLSNAWEWLQKYWYFLGPFGAMIKAVGLIWENWGNIGEFIKSVWDGVVDAIKRFFAWVGRAREQLEGLPVVGVVFKAFFILVTGYFKMWKSVINFIIDKVGWIWEKVKSITSKAKDLPIIGTFFGGDIDEEEQKRRLAAAGFGPPGEPPTTVPSLSRIPTMQPELPSYLKRSPDVNTSNIFTQSKFPEKMEVEDPEAQKTNKAILEQLKINNALLSKQNQDKNKKDAKMGERQVNAHRQHNLTFGP